MDEVISSALIKSITIKSNFIFIIKYYEEKKFIPDSYLTELVKAVVDYFALNGRNDGNLNNLGDTELEQIANSFNVLFDCVPIEELFVHKKGKAQVGKLYNRYQTLCKKFKKFRDALVPASEPIDAPDNISLFDEETSNITNEEYEGLLLDLKTATGKTPLEELKLALKSTFKRRREEILAMNSLDEIPFRIACDRLVFNIFYIKIELVSLIYFFLTKFPLHFKIHFIPYPFIPWEMMSADDSSHNSIFVTQTVLQCRDAEHILGQLAAAGA